MALTGTALELDAKFEVVKKLKLVGYPDKIFKKTAFIKGMFNSDLEVRSILLLLLSPVLRIVFEEFCWSSIYIHGVYVYEPGRSRTP